MKNVPQKFDLTIANVERWREKQELRKWTARRTKLWFQIRDAGTRAIHKPDTYGERWKRIGDRLSYTAMAIAMMLLFEVAFQVAHAIVSGRVQAVLDQIRSSH